MHRMRAQAEIQNDENEYCIQWVRLITLIVRPTQKEVQIVMGWWYLNECIDTNRVDTVVVTQWWCCKSQIIAGQQNENKMDLHAVNQTLACEIIFHQSPVFHLKYDLNAQRRKRFTLFFWKTIFKKTSRLVKKLYYV